MMALYYPFFSNSTACGALHFLRQGIRFVYNAPHVRNAILHRIVNGIDRIGTGGRLRGFNEASLIVGRIGSSNAPQWTLS